MKEKSDRSRLNLLTLRCIGLMSTMLTIAFLIEVLKGNRDLIYFITLIVLAWLPVAVSYVYNRLKPENHWFRYVAGIGWTVFYTFTVFTSESVDSYVYILPLLLILTQYRDEVLLTGINVCSLVVNIIHIVIVIGQSNPENVNSIVKSSEIQVAALAIFAIINFVSCRYQKKHLMNKNDELAEKDKKVNENIDMMKNVAANVADTTENISKLIKELNDNIGNTIFMMKDISTGTTDTAQSIQEQLIMTESIEKITNQVTKMCEELVDIKDNAYKVLEQGFSDVKTLLNNSTELKTESDVISKQMAALNDSIANVYEATEQIGQIASKTAMLALNANIEAARVGENGRGFAVVANDVKNLASITKQSTMEVEKVIKKLQGDSKLVLNSVNRIIACSGEQSQITVQTEQNFKNIENSMHTLGENIDILSDRTNELLTANTKIIESAQSLSSMSEEVASCAENTENIGTRNKDMVGQLVSNIEELNHDAERLISC